MFVLGLIFFHEQTEDSKILMTCGLQSKEINDCDSMKIRRFRSFILATEC